MDEARALARAAIDAFNRGDYDAVRAMLHPEIEVYIPPDLPNNGLYEGPDGYFQMVGQWNEAWDSFSLELTGVDESDGRLVAHVLQHGRGRGSGIEVRQPVIWEFELRDSKVYRLSLRMPD